MLTAKYNNGQGELRNGEALQLLNYLNGGPDTSTGATTPSILGPSHGLGGPSAATQTPTTLTDSKTGILSVKELNMLLNRMLPFVTTNLPGSELYFKEERKNLFAMIRSPIMSNIRFFATFAQPDAYLHELFVNAITSSGKDEFIKNMDHNSIILIQ